MASGSGRYGSASPSIITAYPVSTDAPPASGPAVDTFSSASESSFFTSIAKNAGSTMPALSSIPCCSASRWVVRLGTAKRRARCVVDTVFSADVSLKLRTAMRSMDSPSSGVSVVAGVGFTSAIAGAEIGS